MTDPFIISLTIFVLAVFVGYLLLMFTLVGWLFNLTGSFLA